MDEWWSDLPETIPPWLETLKSPGGLYRMSASAIHEESVDATSLALDLVNMLGLELPPGEIWSIHEFLAGARNVATGFFQEPFCEFDPRGDDRLWEMSATYFGFQVVGIWSALGWQFQYPFSFYDQFLQPGAMSRYMTENMPWATAPMGAGNMVDAAASMVRANVIMGHYEYWHILSEMYQWLQEHQNINHGFWGDLEAQGLDGVVQSGYHILRGLHFQDGRRILGLVPDQLWTVLQCLETPSAPLDGCHHMDCAVLLEHLSWLLYKTGPKDIMASAARQLIDDIRIMRRDDGGFSFSAEGAIKNHNRYEVTPGKMESDLVGTVFYLQALRSALHVLGGEVPWGESATHGVRR